METNPEKVIREAEKVKEKIEVASSIKLNGFPDEDFVKVGRLLEDNKSVEVWLVQGMGRKYIAGYKPGNFSSSLPLKEKLCDLISNPTITRI